MVLGNPSPLRYDDDDDDDKAFFAMAYVGSGQP
jgi:hypothetical protein